MAFRFGDAFVEEHRLESPVFNLGDVANRIIGVEELLNDVSIAQI